MCGVLCILFLSLRNSFLTQTVYCSTLFRCLIFFCIQRRVDFVLTNYPCERSLFRLYGGEQLKMSHLRILGAIRVPRSQFRTEDPYIGGTIQSIVATTTCRLGVVHPWFRAICAAAVADVFNLLFSPICFLNKSPIKLF
jgi:hypothetical protein